MSCWFFGSSQLVFGGREGNEHRRKGRDLSFRVGFGDLGSGWARLWVETLVWEVMGARTALGQTSTIRCVMEHKSVHALDGPQTCFKKPRARRRPRFNRLF